MPMSKEDRYIKTMIKKNDCITQYENPIVDLWDKDSNHRS